ncbi:MAG: flagellar biosynthetic protein FliR [Lachnospiraceae bacterium]|nr:flagellar biosynthetic protein FliR [Lachnospiraceae bacterium]
MIDYSFSLITFEYFLLVMVRITSFVYTAPFFSLPNTPGRVKIGFSVMVSILVFGLIPEPSVSYVGVIGFATIALKEGITGLLIGFAANICNSIVLLAGNIIDMNMGLSMATEYDPVTRTNAPITGNLYNYLVLMMLIVSGMHRYVLTAVVQSFELIPVNEQVFQWDRLLQAMLDYMSQSMILGFRIALPVFACIMILNCVLGVMAKVSPQMNMFSVGMQLKVLVGMIILLFTMQLLPNVTEFVYSEMKRMIVSVIEGMRGM